MTGIQISERFQIAEEQLQWSFSRSSGPGGQNVNKVNSKATLRWQPQPGQLPAAVWARFEKIAQRYLTSDGEVVIQAQEYRDQAKNIVACRTRLRDLLRMAFKPPKRRVATKPTLGSRRRRLDDKRKLAEKKRSRQGKDF